MEEYTNIIVEYGISIILALAIYIVGRWGINIILNIIDNIMQKSEIDEMLKKFILNIIKSLLLIVVFLAVLGQLGIDTTSVVAMLAAAGLAIGLALQGTFSNIGAGVLIIIFKPFTIGHIISAGGETGTVDDMNLFSITLKTLDNRIIIVPNSSIMGGSITNFSLQDTRRVDLVFGIGYDDDLKLAKDTLLEIGNNDERVLQDPLPFVAVSELADSSVNFTVRFWVKSADYWAVHFDTIEKVKLTFDEKNISIPYPQLDLHKIK